VRKTKEEEENGEAVVDNNVRSTIQDEKIDNDKAPERPLSSS